MNVANVSEKQIARDTAKMTLLSLAVQTIGMVFNVMLSQKTGTAAVGLMSLIFSLFSFIMVLANGNILTSTSRFVSEARGAGHSNFSRIMKYSLTFSFCLSMTFAVISFLLAELIGEKYLGSSEMSAAIRFIALSLPFASAGSCIKGFFHGIRMVDIPMKGDLLEFAAKWSALFGGLLLFGGTERFYAVTAASILAGEFISFCYYVRNYLIQYRIFKGMPPCTAPLLTDTPVNYLKSVFPILISGYVQMLLSSANELLVPTALLSYSRSTEDAVKAFQKKSGLEADGILGAITRSTEEALSCYGCFEAMIIPAIFFPSAVIGSLAGIIIPEAALANRSPDPDIRRKRLCSLTDSVFVKVFTYAFFIAALFLFGGKTLGSVMCPENSLVSSSLVILAPVIPFIYMEIVLEGLLKGMGLQNFSTVNSFFEYAARIACVIIFVEQIGFGGVIVSYYASNVISNIARIIKVCKECGLSFDPMRYCVKPLISGFLCCIAGLSAVKLTHAQHSGDFISLAVFVLTSVALFVLIQPRKNKLSVTI